MALSGGKMYGAQLTQDGSPFASFGTEPKRPLDIKRVPWPGLPNNSFLPVPAFLSGPFGRGGSLQDLAFWARL